jgi:hypothetical protein
MTGPIPANPLSDPASNLNTQISSIGQSLKNIGVSQSISDSIVQEIKNKLNAQQSPSSTVQGDYNNILSALGAAGIGFDPKPNILDNCASYTYHIKFCATSDNLAQNVSSHADWEKAPKDVIAESGVTAGFNIRNLEIKNLCGPQNRIGISVETSFTMTLVEPYGLSLVDRMYTLAKDTYGVDNHLKCTYFLEIWFTGYDDDGNIVPIDTKKLFRIVISEISVDSSSTGSIYTINGLMQGSMATSNEFVTPGTHTKIDGVGTFGQFWDKLKTELNSQMKKLDFDFETKRYEYDFVYPQEWRNWQFYRKPTDNPSTASFDFSNNTKLANIDISRGTSIDVILTTVMSMTKEGKDFVLGPISAGKDAGTSSSRAENEGISLIPIIESKVEFVSYNTIYQDYVKKITYYFKPYPTVRSYKDRDFINNSQKLSVQKQRLAEFANSARLQKIYNYMFTGLNTDVIRFDLKLDTYWTASQPLFDGYNSSTTWQLPQSVPGESVVQQLRNEYFKKKAAVDDAAVNLKSIQNLDDETKKLQAYKSELTAAQTALNQATDEFNKFKQSINPMDYEIKFSTNSPGEQAIAGLTVKNKAVWEDPNTRKNLISRAIYQLTRSSAQDQYLEQITPQPPDTNPLIISSTISKQPNLQNTTSGGLGTSDPVSSGGINPPKSRGLLANIIDNVCGSQFATIELEIRGDPYWIGFDNIEGLQYLSPDTPPPISSGSANALFGTGECAFLLYFRTGEEPNEDTGLVEFSSTSWAFNGLYVVVEVDNRFNDGKFTQVLHANKDVAMFSLFNQSPADLLAQGKIPV